MAAKKQAVTKVPNLLERLASAREHIRVTPTKKQGRNSFSKYDYFTPSQISGLVSDACKENGLIATYNFLRGAEGLEAVLTVHEISTGESINFTMAAAEANIKATNDMQKLGGTMTYTERYLKMTAFDITDNNLDLDNGDNRKSTASAQPVAKAVSLKPMTEVVKNAMMRYVEQGDLDSVTSQLPKYADSKLKLEIVEALKKAK